MRSGTLRHRVSIEHDTGSTQDAEGHITEVWTQLANRWARIEPLTGRELFNARQVQPDITHKVTLRYYSGLTEKMRIRHGTRYLYPVEPPRNKDERNVELEVMCKEAK